MAKETEYIILRIHAQDLERITGFALGDSNGVRVRIQLQEIFVAGSKIFPDLEKETIFEGEGNNDSVAVSQAMVRMVTELNERKFEHGEFDNIRWNYWSNETPVHIDVNPDTLYRAFIEKFLNDNLKLNLWEHKQERTL